MTFDYAGQVSVVVPVKNEADNILPLIEEIHASLEGKAEFEIIYVDDGSTRCHAAATGAGAAAIHPTSRHPPSPVVRPELGSGHGGSRRAAPLDRHARR